MKYSLALYNPYKNHSRASDALTRGAPISYRGLSYSIASLILQHGLDIEYHEIGQDGFTRKYDIMIGANLNTKMIKDYVNRRFFYWYQSIDALREIEYMDESNWSPNQDIDMRIIVPSNHFFDRIGIPSLKHNVLYSAFEEPKASNVYKAIGKKVLHTQAFDRMKGTKLAIEVARNMPNTEFVFRSEKTGNHYNYTIMKSQIADMPSNITILDPTHDRSEELWKDIGCVFVPSLSETFSCITFEAYARGIPVVHSLEVISEWARRGLTNRNIKDLSQAISYCISNIDMHIRKDLYEVAYDTYHMAQEQVMSIIKYLASLTWLD